MRSVTLDNYQSFMGNMVEVSVASDDDLYETHSFEVPMHIKTGSNYELVAARGSVKVRKENAQPPVLEGFASEDDYKVALHNFNATPEFAQLATLAEEAVAEDLHKLISMYGLVYFETTV